MGWSTIDADAFLGVAGDLLRQDLVAQAPLLSELGFLAAQRVAGAAFGVWSDAADRVGAAYVVAPGHPVLLSRLPDGGAPVDGLVVGLPWEVDVRDLPVVERRLSGRGLTTREGGALRLHRLADSARPEPASVDPRGRARIAREPDRALLERWYAELLGGLDDDATELSFLVDEPLDHGGAVLWEVDGVPVAVAVRTRVVAGVTKITAAWSPYEPRYADAAFVAACRAARESATTVVAVDRPGADDRLLRGVGFEVVAGRVLVVGEG